MNTQAIAHLLAGIGTAHVIGFFIVLARITPLFLIAPVFSSPLLIPQVRGVLAVALAMGLTTLAMHGQTIPTDPYLVAGLMLVNVLVGLVVAFAVACVFAAVEGAGAIADFSSGFSFGASVDPVNGNQGGALTNFYTMVGMALFLLIGGDAWTLRGLAATFRVVPLTGGPHIQSLAAGVEQMLVSVTVGAVEIAAPVILALTIADVAFGMVSKVVPQLNVFAVGFPMKVGIALLVVAASMPFVGTWMDGQLQGAVTSAVQVL